MSELIGNLCSHCGRADVCTPCGEGNPPYKREPVTDPKGLTAAREHLEAIPGLYAQVGLFREPGSAPPDPDARQGTTNPSKPTVRLEVVDLLDERLTKHGADKPGTRDVLWDKENGGRRLGVLGTLGLWVVMSRTEMLDQGLTVGRCCEDTDSHTVDGECAWLHQRSPWIVRHHPDFVEELTWMRRDLDRMCGNRPPERVYCPKCANRVEGRDDDAWFQCVGCQTTWVAGAEIQRLFALQPPMTLRQISTTLRIPLRTLYNWEAEGRFMPVTPDHRFPLAVRKAAGAKVYDVEHVKRAAIRTSKTGPTYTKEKP